MVRQSAVSTAAEVMNGANVTPTAAGRQVTAAFEGMVISFCPSYTIKIAAFNGLPEYVLRGKATVETRCHHFGNIFEGHYDFFISVHQVSARL